MIAIATALFSAGAPMTFGPQVMASTKPPNTIPNAKMMQTSRGISPDSDKLYSHFAVLFCKATVRMKKNAPTAPVMAMKICLFL